MKHKIHTIFWKTYQISIQEVFSRFESGKGAVVDVLYRRRGKYARPFIHVAMVALVFFGVTLGPLMLNDDQNALANAMLPQAEVLGLSSEDLNEYGTATMTSQAVLAYRGGEVVEYEVKEGDTLSTIADKFELNVDTILWANGLDSETTKIRQGQKLSILPLNGVLHRVKKGETVYSVAKKYSVDPQPIVDYPFNNFTNDETFALAIGQTLMVPDGVMPKKQIVAPTSNLATILTPDAGAVSALGSFVWPAAGRITQRYSWYHKAIDIANKNGGPILAADSGRVIVAGWPDNSGYGNRVMLDHGNGYVTLYGHMSSIAVVVGQSVNRGDVLGQMGSTGRSTGTHLHFEIRASSALQNPLNFLK